MAAAPGPMRASSPPQYEPQQAKPGHMAKMPTQTAQPSDDGGDGGEGEPVGYNALEFKVGTRGRRCNTQRGRGYQPRENCYDLIALLGHVYRTNPNPQRLHAYMDPLSSLNVSPTLNVTQHLIVSDEVRELFKFIGRYQVWGMRCETMSLWSR